MTGGHIKLQELIKALLEVYIEDRGAMQITLNVNDQGKVAKISITEFFK